MLDNRILKTNENTVARTNKEQITFFSKIYWGLIRDKYLEKKFLLSKILQIFYFDYFWEMLSLLIV